MNYIKLLVITTFSLLLLSITGQAKASSINIVATGYIQTVESGLSSEFTVGDIFTLNYSYETMAIDTNTFNEQRGAYWGAISAASLTVGDYSLVMSGGEIIIDNNLVVIGGVDRYQASMRQQLATFSGATVSGLSPYYTAIDLTNFDGTAFSSDSLPTTAPNLSDFENLAFELVFAEGYNTSYAWGVQNISGTVTSIGVVPEPSTIFLLGSGLTCLAFFRRKLKV